MFSSINMFALVLFIIFFVKWLYTSYTNSRKKNLPPSPWKLPIIGNLHQIISSPHPHRTLQSLSKKYGPDLMLLHFGNKPVLVVSSANAAKEILKTKDSIFASRPKLIIPDKLLYNSRDISFLPYGENWRITRNICINHLLSNKMVQSFRRIREEETSDLIRNIYNVLETSSSSNSNSLINLSDSFVNLTHGVICRAAIGKKYGGKKARVALSEFVELLGTICVGDYVPWLPWWNKFNGLDSKVNRVHREIDELLEIAIQEHAAAATTHGRRRPTELYGNNNNQYFVDILLDLESNDNSTTKTPIERDTIKAIILDMFLAGTDTTYSTMEWTMTELLRHGKIMEKLQNEVRKVVSIEDEVTEDDMDKMHYLKAVIKETLRLHFPNPLMVPHVSTSDVKVMGYDVSAGTQVIINGWNIARDPNFWDNPEKFQPDKFDYNCKDTTGDGDGDGGGGSRKMIDYRGFDFEFIPFGAGRRMCPGMNFAIAVAELTLAKLLHKFDFELPNNISHEEEKCDHIPESSGLVVHRKFPLLVHVVAHANASSSVN